MQRLRASWTRWRLSRMRRRQQRLREKLAPVLAPILAEALEQLAHPMVLAMGRLDDRQQETLSVSLQVSQQLMVLPEQLQAVQVQPMAELKELLVEILSSLQPPAEQQIGQLLGQPLQPISSPSSAS